jgi:hypothetical protein
MARPVQIAIDCADPDLLAVFWTDVLRYRVDDPPPGYGSWPDFSRAVGSPGEAWSRVVDPDGVGPPLLFHRVPEAKVVKNRVHLDIRLSDIGVTPMDVRRSLVDGERTRLVGAGATHVRTDADETDYYADMQDPEGNEFCIG